ncbi:methyltransferase domain-containing protein [Ferrovibrio terrae]|uniref:methyltransferase domain-containing protein n=1 Tax=Ferrovibrio terrae TaxID=2594003 RepID=UPI0031381D52
MSLPDSKAIAEKAHLLPILRAAMRAIEGGQFEQAEGFLDSLLQQEPDFADAIHLKGYIALQRGNLDLARSLVERAIAIDFHFENYHLTLGHILLAAGDRQAAQTSFGSAIVLNQKMPDPYIGLAHLFIGEGALDAAIGALQTARPLGNQKHPEVNYMLGFALMAKGDAKNAMMYFGRALQAAPDVVRYKVGFARSLRDLRLKKPDPGLIAMALPLLGSPGIEPRDLEPLIESAIRLDPMFIALSAVDPLPPAAVAAVLSRPDAPDLAAIEPLAAWLAHGLVSHPGIANRLMALRRGLLHLAVHQPYQLERHRRFIALLAIRAFQSEYIDRVAPDEQALLQQLDAALATLEADAAADRFAVFAIYQPLYRRSDAERLVAITWPFDYADLKRSQLDEPLAERQIAASMPALMPIEDATSRFVQEMYEESPFPRWHQPILGTPLSVPVRLRTALPMQTIPASRVAKPDVLVAGCGTGLHAILAATSYLDAKVLAIDLSRTSLAYAKRKADEIGVANVEFAQADILQIGAIDRRFDVIESFGVLHHLRDPAAGLAQLVKLLRPDGYMMLGLYSEIGRRDVVAARELIAKHGYSDSPDDVRRFRHDVLRLAPDLAMRLMQSSAFHTLSDLRDLVFHRQEHRYTPAQLRLLIDEAGLEFLGFEFNSPKPLTGYRARFPQDLTAANLDNWATVELENPGLFSNCYRFWVRHKA